MQDVVSRDEIFTTDPFKSQHEYPPGKGIMRRLFNRCAQKCLPPEAFPLMSSQEVRQQIVSEICMRSR